MDDRFKSTLLRITSSPDIKAFPTTDRDSAAQYCRPWKVLKYLLAKRLADSPSHLRKSYPPVFYCCGCSITATVLYRLQVECNRKFEPDSDVCLAKRTAENAPMQLCNKSKVIAFQLQGKLSQASKMKIITFIRFCWLFFSFSCRNVL
jgi:hypothetical protein